MPDDMSRARGRRPPQPPQPPHSLPPPIDGWEIGQQIGAIKTKLDQHTEEIAEHGGRLTMVEGGMAIMRDGLGKVEETTTALKALVDAMRQDQAAAAVNVAAIMAWTARSDVRDAKAQEDRQKLLDKFDVFRPVALAAIVTLGALLAQKYSKALGDVTSPVSLITFGLLVAYYVWAAIRKRVQP